MLAYATSTGTKTTLAALAAAGWGLLLTPDAPYRKGFDRIAIDNGAFGCWQKNIAWTPDKWQAIVEAHGHDADWCVAPDVVMGGTQSLALTLYWLPWMLHRCKRVLIAVQPGIEPEAIQHMLGDKVGIFIGGDTEWKEQTLPVWGALSRQTGCWLHVGRVNTKRRIRLCQLSGCDSFDGTSAVQFPSTLPMLDRARRQGVWEFDL